MLVRQCVTTCRASHTSVLTVAHRARNTTAMVASASNIAMRALPILCSAHTSMASPAPLTSRIPMVCAFIIGHLPLR